MPAASNPAMYNAAAEAEGGERPLLRANVALELILF
jgi:hypothetical protein